MNLKSRRKSVREPVSPLSSGSDLLHADIACEVKDPSQVGEARRIAVAIATECGFSETDCGRVALIVTEGATNLIKHAGQGTIVIRRLADAGLEILILDKGPGMSHPEKCLGDGYSTAGSPGTGLGAISRMADVFDLYTVPTRGCAVLARLGTLSGSGTTGAWKTGAVCIPKPGESDCGDAWAIVEAANETCVLVVDGLGHGTDAARTANEAVRAFQSHCHLEPVALVQRIHEAMRHTRGAAAAVAKIRQREQKIRFVGVGNISAACHYQGQCRSMVSQNGTLGMEARKIQEFVYDLPQGAQLIFHSDGIATRWRLSDAPGLAFRDPSLIAGVLYRDFQRGGDDATVLVLSS
jgi:anti-sigma regulatory factor (Ser/Thr protein kinase)